MYNPERRKHLWAEHVEILGEAAFHLYDTYFRPLYAEYMRNNRPEARTLPLLSEDTFLVQWQENSNDGQAFRILLSLDLGVEDRTTPSVVDYITRYRS